MKEAPALILWVSIVVVVGIGVWLVTGGSLPFSRSQTETVQPPSDVQSAEEHDVLEQAKATSLKKPPAKTRQKTRKSDVASESVIVAPPAEVVVAAPIEVARGQIAPPAPKQFPSANEISIGAKRENISEKFGEPSLATITTSGDGRLMETLVYARKSGRDVTVIRMQDGKVLSAYSR
jgi:hypothetical protein